MISKKRGLIILFIILLSFVVSICFYPHMPDKVATHFNEKMEADGYSGKFFGTFVMPISIIIIALFFLFIPRIDPLKKNYDKFKNYYEGLVLVVLIFIFAIHVWMLLWNVGIKINFFFSVLMGLMFFYLGFFCENAKRNWFAGIRTPWTLSNDNVWEKTHKVGGKLMKIAGIIIMFGAFFDEYHDYFFLGPIIIVAVITIIYSYVEYRQ